MALKEKHLKEKYLRLGKNPPNTNKQLKNNTQRISWHLHFSQLTSKQEISLYVEGNFCSNLFKFCKAIRGCTRIAMHCVSSGIALQSLQ